MIAVRTLVITIITNAVALALAPACNFTFSITTATTTITTTAAATAAIAAMVTGIAVSKFRLGAKVRATHDESAMVDGAEEEAFFEGEKEGGGGGGKGWRCGVGIGIIVINIIFLNVIMFIPLISGFVSLASGRCERRVMAVVYAEPVLHIASEYIFSFGKHNVSQRPNSDL